jgi:hypothetical protein
MDWFAHEMLPETNKHLKGFNIPIGTCAQAAEFLDSRSAWIQVPGPTSFVFYYKTLHTAK